MDKTSIKHYLHEHKLGFIGAGKMAQAIADGLIKQGVVSPADVIASAPSDANLRLWKNKGMNTTYSNEEVVKTCSTIFLAVKPQYLEEALSNIQTNMDVTERLFVSVIAGITSASLEEVICKLVPSARIVRVMPNTPLLVGEGCSVFSGGKTASKEDCLLVKALLSDLGMCIEVKENLIGAAGAISGCGPAFMYLLIEAIADGGVKMGVPREMAQKLAAQTMLGAAQMVLQTGRHPGQLKDEVCSPAGTTIAGVQVLENHSIRSAMMAAVEASTLKSAELGRKK